MSREFDVQQTSAPHAPAAAVLSRRKCGCGASHSLGGVCEECRREPHASAARAGDSAARTTNGAASHTGHDFGRLSVLAPGSTAFAPNDQTPAQSGGLDEKFLQGNAPAPGAEKGAGPELNLGEKTTHDSNKPVVDKVELVTSLAGAVGGYKDGEFACDVSLNQPGPFNDIWYSGSVANSHQVQFHLSQGRPEDLRVVRLAKRTSTRGGKTYTKPGTDSPTADDGPPPHEYQFTKDKLVIADAPGWCKPFQSLKDSDFPLTYSADFSTYAYDPLDKSVVASISYHVEISKTDFMQNSPTNTATVTGVKLGGAVPSPVKPKK